MGTTPPFDGIYSQTYQGQYDDNLPSAKKGKIRKHVEWLNTGEGKAYKAKRALAWIERIILDLTVVCLPSVKSAVAYRDRFRARELGKAYVENVLKEGKKPPEYAQIYVTSDRAAMNHTTYYAINDGVIWHKPIKEGSDWQPLPFTAGTQPIKIRVDGANLCVEDDKGEIYYRKILREGKREPESGTTYVFRDKSERNNFKKNWFTLPVVSEVIKPFTSARLKRDPSKTIDWAIAHRGQFNHYIEDAVGQKHCVDVGVTTLYMLDANGRDIRLYDPWKPEWVEVSVPTPETSHSQYEAMKMEVAASTVMTIGYNTATDQAGKTTKSLQINTLLIDIDGLGWNPGLHFDYKQDPNNKDVRVLGEVKWQTHALPDQPGDRFSKQITILQTGEGNQARELRVAGMRNSETGFFYKSLGSQEWQFKPVKGLQIDPSDLLAREEELNNKPDYRAPDYRAKDYTVDNVTLKDFTKDKVSSFIEFGNHKIMVYRKVNIIKKAIGKTGEKYDLVIPDTMSRDDVAALKKTLGVTKERGIKLDDFLRKAGVTVEEENEAENSENSRLKIEIDELKMQIKNLREYPPYKQAVLNIALEPFSGTSASKDERKLAAKMQSLEKTLREKEKELQ
ncbi:MAG: hypothetical protein JSS12_09165 [Verrucomicrobia bacterium]|nr:hypothetical protein [Verrucomicrobiota bacterium]